MDQAPVGPMTGGTDPTLEALSSGLPPEDARALREERAAILEHEAGFTKEEAEHRAGGRRSTVGLGAVNYGPERDATE
jgi:hypothetical protein